MITLGKCLTNNAEKREGSGLSYEYDVFNYNYHRAVVNDIIELCEMNIKINNTREILGLEPVDIAESYDYDSIEFLMSVCTSYCMTYRFDTLDHLSVVFNVDDAKKVLGNKFKEYEEFMLMLQKYSSDFSEDGSYMSLTVKDLEYFNYNYIKDIAPKIKSNLAPDPTGRILLPDDNGNELPF